MKYIYATVKERTKYKAVQRCIQLENEGFECFRKIEPKTGYRKRFGHNGKNFVYQGVDNYTFYEALYRKESK